MEQKKENKVQFWTLPTDWQPELTKGARKMYSRLMCLSAGATKECTYTTEQAMKELGASEKTVRRYVTELTENCLIETARTSNSFGKGVRVITLVANKAPESPQKQRLQSGHITGHITGQMTSEMTDCNRSCDRSKIQKMTGLKSALRLYYTRPESDSPFLIIKRNKELLVSRSVLVSELAPQLFSDLVTFNLSHLKQYLNDDFTPWGEPHPCMFDFTGLWDIVTYPEDTLDSLMDADPLHFYMFHEDKELYWRQFFIMTALIELTCYSNQIFKDIKQYDPTGRNFHKFYFDHQYGFPFTIINSVYAVDEEGAERGELDGHIVYKTMRDKFQIGRSSLLTFAHGFVIQEALNIINDPDLCERAYLGWRSTFSRIMTLSFEPHYLKDIGPSNPDYCKGYFNPDFARHLLCDEKGLAPRFFFPTLLFRRLVNIHTATRLREDGINGDNNRRAIDFIRAQRTKESIRKEWDVLCEHLADAFPFMTKEGVFEHV